MSVQQEFKKAIEQLNDGVLEYTLAENTFRRIDGANRIGRYAPRAAEIWQQSKSGDDGLHDDLEEILTDTAINGDVVNMFFRYVRKARGVNRYYFCAAKKQTAQ